MLQIEQFVEEMALRGYELTGSQPHLFGVDSPSVDQLELAEFQSNSYFSTDFSSIRDRVRLYGLEVQIQIVKGAATGPTIVGASPHIVRFTRSRNATD